MRQDSRIELNIASNPESLPEVRTAAERMARQEGFGDADAHRLVLAIDEALANVIKHGYEGRPDQPITITLEKAKSAEGRVGIAVTVRDQGRQVDPQTIKGRPLDDIRPGGLGVHIIRTVMDEYSYSCPEEGGMMLRMIKYISDDGTQQAPRDLPANDRVEKK